MPCIPHCSVFEDSGLQSCDIVSLGQQFPMSGGTVMSLSSEQDWTVLLWTWTQYAPSKRREPLAPTTQCHTWRLESSYTSKIYNTENGRPCKLAVTITVLVMKLTVCEIWWICIVCPDEVRSKRKGFLTATSESVGRNSSVGITTRYGLDAPEIECRFGRDFRIRPDRPWRPSSLLHSGYRVSFLGVKRPGRGVGHPPTSSVEVKERVVLYLYTPSPPLGRKCLF